MWRSWFHSGREVDSSVKEAAMPRPKSLVKTSDLKDNKIYILTAMNRHNQRITITTDNSMPESLKSREKFLTENMNKRYWVQRDGKIEIKVEIKTVPPVVRHNII
jgi:predicted DNA-binding protein (MmcQ/YjbR family)